MPCRSYEEDNNSDLPTTLRNLNNMLSRIACKALQHIEDMNDGAEFLLLKDPEIHEWWSNHKAADKREKARIAKYEAADREKERLRVLKVAVLARLTPDELAAIKSK
jgi:hypothetical protein